MVLLLSGAYETRECIDGIVWSHFFARIEMKKKNRQINLKQEIRNAFIFNQLFKLEFIALVLAYFSSLVVFFYWEMEFLPVCNDMPWAYNTSFHQIYLNELSCNLLSTFIIKHEISLSLYKHTCVPECMLILCFWQHTRPPPINSLIQKSWDVTIIIKHHDVIFHY